MLYLRCVVLTFGRMNGDEKFSEMWQRLFYVDVRSDLGELVGGDAVTGGNEKCLKAVEKNSCVRLQLLCDKPSRFHDRTKLLDLIQFVELCDGHERRFKLVSKHIQATKNKNACIVFVKPCRQKISISQVLPVLVFKGSDQQD